MDSWSSVHARYRNLFLSHRVHTGSGVHMQSIRSINLHFMVVLRMPGYVSPLSPTSLRRDVEFSTGRTYIFVKKLLNLKFIQGIHFK
jgi:hypothetical protein